MVNDSSSAIFLNCVKHYVFFGTYGTAHPPTASHLSATLLWENNLAKLVRFSTSGIHLNTTWFYLVVNTVTTELERVNTMERNMLQKQTVARVIKIVYFLMKPEVCISILYEPW